jgi:hypothetical protein
MIVPPLCLLLRFRWWATHKHCKVVASTRIEGAGCFLGGCNRLRFVLWFLVTGLLFPGLCRAKVQDRPNDPAANIDTKNLEGRVVPNALQWRVFLQSPLWVFHVSDVWRAGLPHSFHGRESLQLERSYKKERTKHHCDIEEKHLFQTISNDRAISRTLNNIE